MPPRSWPRPRTSRVETAALPSAAASARCRPSTERIWLNMSLGTLVSTSMLRVGASPRSRNFWMGGIPWPIIISTGEASETEPPESTIICSSVSLRVVQWM